MRRVRWGVRPLDDMLGGGLLEGAVMLLAGSAGSGKTTLAMQFLLEGLRCGEPAAYLSLEEDRLSLFRNMLGFGWDLQAVEDDGRLYFEHFRTEELVRHIADGYQLIDRRLRETGAKRLVVDSVSAYLLACDSELRRRAELKRLLGHIRKWGVTAVLTGEDGKAQDGCGVDYMVDSIIRMRSRREGCTGARMRFLEIEKTRGSWHSTDIMEYEITGEGVVFPGKKQPKIPSVRGWPNSATAWPCR